MGLFTLWLRFLVVYGFVIIADVDLVGLIYWQYFEMIGS